MVYLICVNYDCGLIFKDIEILKWCDFWIIDINFWEKKNKIEFIV